MGNVAPNDRYAGSRFDNDWCMAYVVVGRRPRFVSEELRHVLCDVTLARGKSGRWSAFEESMKETMGNAFVPGSASLSPEENEMITRRTRLLGPAYRLFYARPLQIVRGE